MQRCQSRSGQCSGGLSSSEALNAHLELEIEKLRRELSGSRSERKARLLEQMELQLENMETAATEDELAAETAAVGTQTVQFVPAQAAFTKAVTRSSPARAHSNRRTRKLSLLRLGEAAEAGRGQYRDAGDDPAAVEGDSDGTREVLVPGHARRSRSRRHRSMSRRGASPGRTCWP